MPGRKLDEVFMRLAIREARKGLGKTNPNPAVGAVLVRNDQLISKGWHRAAGSAHAEIEALRKAPNPAGCTLYVTLEPCSMCSGAAMHARLARVVFGATEPKTGAAGSVLNLFDNPQLNHQTQVTGGVLADECVRVLQSFFEMRRAQKKTEKSLNNI